MPAEAVREERCLIGQGFYTCAANSFQGCCSVDPCDDGFCPDNTGDGNSPASAVTSSPSPDPSPPPSPKRDSGITHTVPNQNVITLTRTRRTTIQVTASPAPISMINHYPTDSTASFNSLTNTDLPTSAATSQVTRGSGTATPLPAETAPAANAGDADHRATLSSGAIVGIVGSLIFAAIAAVLLFFGISRKRNRQRKERDEVGNVSSNNDQADSAVEKQQHLTANTTGTQVSSDPFAPFGGRVDRPVDPFRPPEQTYEMDNTSIDPVELPAETDLPLSPGSELSASPPKARTSIIPMPESPARDPRANLNPSQSEPGQAAYVNSWSQWRALGEGNSHYRQAK